MNWKNRILFGCNLAIFGVVAWYAITRGIGLRSEEWRYQELVGIMLATVTVVLGALGIGIAVLALYGRKAIEEEAVKAAIDRVDKVISSKILEAIEAPENQDRLRKAIEIEKEDEEAKSGTLAPDAPQKDNA